MVRREAAGADPGPLQRLLAAADPSSGETLLAAIHKFAGGAAYCGIPRVQTHCHALEGALRQGLSPEALEPELLELQDLLERLRIEAEAWLQS